MGPPGPIGPIGPIGPNGRDTPPPPPPEPPAPFRSRPAGCGRASSSLYDFRTDNRRKPGHVLVGTRTKSAGGDGGTDGNSRGARAAAGWGRVSDDVFMGRPTSMG